MYYYICVHTYYIHIGMSAAAANAIIARRSTNTGSKSGGKNNATILTSDYILQKKKEFERIEKKKNEKEHLENRLKHIKDR